MERSYRMTSPAVQQKLVELLEQIPYEHLLLTDELVAMIRSRVNYPLNESLLITLADHISFAIQRSEQGIRFSNPLMAPIREFYPEEYRLGMECLAVGLFHVLAFVLPTCLRAAGDAKYTMYVGVLSMFFARVAGAYILGTVMGLGVVGTRIAMYIDWIVRIVFFAIRYKSGKWTQYRAIE